MGQETLSYEDIGKLRDERKSHEGNYERLRFGKLPEGTFRILEMGGINGWFFQLELGSEEVVLREPGKENSEFSVFFDKSLAFDLARKEIALRYGDVVAEKAAFMTIWGGTL